MDKVSHIQVPPKYRNQLTEYMLERELPSFIRPFVKYQEEDKAIIVLKEGLLAILLQGKS